MSNTQVIVGNPVDGYYGPFPDTHTAFTWAVERNFPGFFVGALRAPESFKALVPVPARSDAQRKGH